MAEQNDIQNNIVHFLQLTRNLLQGIFSPEVQNLLEALQQPPAAENGEKQILDVLYHAWRTRTIAVKMDLQEFIGDLSEFKENEKCLRVEVPRKLPKIELGDLVKIKMKHRQIKQITKGGWNDLIKMDINEIATVIGILIPDGAEVVISFPKSGQRWVINAYALEVMHAKQERPTNCWTNLKIGDSVMIPTNVPDYVITIMQNVVSLSAQAAINVRNSLLKLLAFVGRDIAIVSFDKYSSIMLHAGLLSRKPETDTSPSTPSWSFAACYAIGKQYIVKNNIETLIKLPHWSYRHSKILGKVCNICYHGPSGELGIRVEGEGYFITTEYLGRDLRADKAKKQRRPTGEHKSYAISSQFPFPVGAAVQFKLEDDERCKRMLNDLKIPCSFLKVVREECTTFLGYDALGRAHIEFQIAVGNKVLWQNFTLITPIVYLKRAPKAIEAEQKQMLKQLKSIKVNDEVSLNGAKHRQFICEELDLISTADKIKSAMTSNAKLMAFDDENDRVILEYGNGRRFSCFSGYVDVARPDLPSSSPGRIALAYPSSFGRVISPNDDDEEDFEPGTSRLSLSEKKDHTEVIDPASLNDITTNTEDSQDETVPKSLFGGVEETSQENSSADREEENPTTTSNVPLGRSDISPGSYQDNSSADREEDNPSTTSNVPLRRSDISPGSYQDNSSADREEENPSTTSNVPLGRSDISPGSYQDNSSADREEESPSTTTNIPSGRSDISPGSTGGLRESPDVPSEPSNVAPEVSSQRRSILEGAIPSETHPTVRFDPTTNDFVVYGNLGRHAQPSGLTSLLAELGRQDSTRSAPTDNNNASTIIGGAQNNFHISNSVFNGPVNMGTSATIN